MSVAAVILAAGGSSRTPDGRNELLMYRGKSLLRRTVDVAIDAGCRPVTVVIGAFADQMREELAGIDVDIIENPRWQLGMGTSVKAGVAAVAVDDDVDGVLLLVCDQPGLRSDVMRELVDVWSRSGLTIAAADYGASLGVPAVFSRALLPDLLALSDANGAKRLIDHNRDRVAVVPFPRKATNIDTPDDAAKLETEAVNV